MKRDQIIGFISGIFGGGLKFLLDIKVEFWINLVGAAITAVICGAAGVAGKDCYVYIKKKIKR